MKLPILLTAMACLLAGCSTNSNTGPQLRLAIERLGTTRLESTPPTVEASWRLTIENPSDQPLRELIIAIPKNPTMPNTWATLPFQENAVTPIQCSALTVASNAVPLMADPTFRCQLTETIAPNGRIAVDLHAVGDSQQDSAYRVSLPCRVHYSMESPDAYVPCPSIEQTVEGIENTVVTEQADTSIFVDARPSKPLVPTDAPEGLVPQRAEAIGEPGKPPPWNTSKQWISRYVIKPREYLVLPINTGTGAPDGIQSLQFNYQNGRRKGLRGVYLSFSETAGDFAIPGEAIGPLVSQGCRYPADGGDARSGVILFRIGSHGDPIKGVCDLPANQTIYLNVTTDEPADGFTPRTAGCQVMQGCRLALIFQGA